MKNLLLSAGLLCCSFAAFSQNEIAYTVSFPNAVHHEAEITMVVPALSKGPLTVRMSRSSPGRYATHEFGKNVYRVTAADASGKALKINRIAGDVYEIPAPGANVKISYTLYGNWIDGTYAGFDRNYVHINMPSTFMFPAGMDARARTVVFKYPDKPLWKVATQLKPLGNNKFYAMDLQYFMDSPVEITDYKTASWEVPGKEGKTQTIHLIANTADTQPVVNKYAEMVKVLVNEEAAVWGEFPVYDYGNYYFLQSLNPENAGDGMEHRNSTVITGRTPKIEGNESALLSTFAHEYFHSWNVERLRPKTLEPFNFAHANMSNELWIAEGFTQYYGNLLLKRAGFRTTDQCTRTFEGLVNAVLNSPGAKNYSAVDASNYAVFADAGVAIDQTNKTNIFTSYYTYGAAIALALDLRLRADFKLTLDDYMRALWVSYGKTEIAYTISDLQKVLGNLTKDQAFADNFFRQYIYGTAKNDYAGLLLKAGFILKKAAPDKAWTGIGRMEFLNGKAVMHGTAEGSPAYTAGLDAGDVILTIDGTEIKDQASLSKLTAEHKPGDKLEIAYTHRGIAYTTSLTLAEDPDFDIVPIEKTGGELTAAMSSFRDAWLNTKIK